MIAGDIDQGTPAGRVIMVPTTGVDVGSELVYGSARSFAWANGGKLETEDISWLARSWQARGGQSADSLAALRIMLRQLEVLAKNPDMQPVYFQFGATASGEATSATEYDGWYLINSLQSDHKTHFRGPLGPIARVKATLTRITGPTPPGPLSMSYTGSALSSTYTATPANLVALPVGASGPPFATSRVAAEGTVPIVIVPSTGPNPVPIIPSATPANLWLGGVRCYDSVAAGSNAVPTTGAAVHTSWVPLYGPTRALTGDLILSNGLLLWRFNQGGTIDIWCWNTDLSTDAWQQVGTLAYRDSSLNNGSIRSIDLERVGLRSSRATVRMSTSAGHFAQIAVDLDAGHYLAFINWTPMTEANSVGRGLALLLSTAVKMVANEGGVVDVATLGATILAPTAVSGWSVGIGSTANQLLVGQLWGQPPNSGQPLAQSTTEMGFGRTTGPAQGATELFGVWAAPFGASTASLMGEAESGTLGTGWSSTADGAASGGNVARCANGTASGNADTWGTAFVPPAGKYRMRVRVKLGSLVSSTSQMKIGLFNSTDSVYVGSVTLAPNAAALTGGTSFIEVDVTGLVTPTAAKQMRFRAETTATTTTNWDFDQAVLIPEQSATLGQDTFPADVFSQLAGRRRLQLVMG